MILKIFAFLVYALCCNADGPSWPSQYLVQGRLQLPYAEIVEPFTAYWDSPQNRSRIDYYGTMVKTLQLGGNGAGAAYKIAPMTDDLKGITNQQTCFSMAGTPLQPVGPQSILPDLTGFKKIGTGRQHDQDCDIYQMTSKIGEKKNTYTMWLVNNQSKNISVPVRYEMMGYDTLIGSHYDKYYLDYDIDSLQTGASAVPAQLFDIKNVTEGKNCSGFPGPGAEQRVLINPMAEYINRHDDHINPMFDHFKTKHGKKYHDDTEHAERKHTFRQNLRFIHSTNRAGKSYRVALNHMADFSSFELQARRGYHHSSDQSRALPFSWNKKQLKEIPDHVDWRLYGAVTPVKDQAVCGSCWSFGTSGAVEGALFIKTGRLVRLSQQALMDCSWGEGNNGCDGGEDFRAYDWIQRHGLPTADSYGEYLAADGYCHVDNATIGAQIRGYVNVTSGDLHALQVAIAQHGPISVAIDASHKSLVFYANGIYYDEQCGSDPDSLDHAVLAVGYGTLNGQAYWLVKNSWSTYWGNDGYVLMSQKNNNCGVATTPTFVLM